MRSGSFVQEYCLNKKSFSPVRRKERVGGGVRERGERKKGERRKGWGERRERRERARED